MSLVEDLLSLTLLTKPIVAVIFAEKLRCKSSSQFVFGKNCSIFCVYYVRNFKVSLANTIVSWHKGTDIMPSATDDCRLDMLVNVNNVNNFLVRLCNVRKPQTKIAADDSLIF